MSFFCVPVSEMFLTPSTSNKLDKIDRGKVDKTEQNKQKFLMDPADPLSKCSRRFF